MGKISTLSEIYKELTGDKIPELFVIPLIRFSLKRSDYLYLLYKEIITNKSVHIHSTSVWNHWKFVWYQFRKKDVLVHYHWFECQDFKALTGMLYKSLCLFIYSSLGGKLVWTIHNKMPHDKNFFRLNYILRRWMASNAQLLHVHCSGVIEELSKFYDVTPAKFRIIEHPEYPAEKKPRKEAIQVLNDKFELGLDHNEKILLMFGNISGYKKMDEVCKLFSEIKPINKKLVISGPVKKGQLKLFKKLKEYSEENPDILLIPRFIKEEDVIEFMNAADVVIFNYREILTSGSVKLAMSFHKRIILPAIGCLKELDGENLTFFTSKDELKNYISNI